MRPVFSMEAPVMKRSLRREFVYLLLFGILVTASCSSPPPPAKPPKTKKTITFISNTASDFWKIVRKGCDKADAELPDVEVIFKTPFTGTAKDQDKLLRDSVDKDTDAVAISPVDPVAQKKLINEAAARVPVITQDSDAPDSNRLFYLGADNLAAGRQVGELLKKALPQGGKIMVFVGNKEAQNAKERFEGLKQSVQGSKVEIIDLMTDDNDHTKAKENAAEALEKHPDLAGLIGLWSYNGPAILQAVKNANKVGKVKIIAFDDEVDTLDGIRSGAITATVAQQPFEYGYQAIHLLAKIIKGDKSVIPADKKILIPTIVVQKTNLDEFRNKLTQLLSNTPASQSPGTAAKPAATAAKK